MDKSIAEEILQMAEIEMFQKGGVSYQTTLKMKDAVCLTKKDYLDYLYPDGHMIMFNSGRWKRHFLEQKLT